MSLIYSLVYTPLKPDWDSNLPRYTCVDNKIHIRFRDFTSPQVIQGFESKLTYLVCYLFHFCYLPSIVKSDSEKDLIFDFSNCPDMQKINITIKNFTEDSKYKGIKLTKNYNKKDNWKFFGEADVNCFPVVKDNNISKQGSLQVFLENLNNIPLVSYLFNDNYKLYIHETKPQKTSKFIKKQLRKESVDEESDLIELW